MDVVVDEEEELRVCKEESRMQLVKGLKVDEAYAWLSRARGVLLYEVFSKARWSRRFIRVMYIPFVKITPSTIVAADTICFAL